MRSNLCETVSQEFTAYLDGELSPSERTQVAQHLEGCDACRSELEEIGRLRKDLRSMEPTSEALDPQLRARILAAIPSGSPAGFIGRFGLQFGRPMLAFGALAAAALLLFTFLPREFGQLSRAKVSLNADKEESNAPTGSMAASAPVAPPAPGDSAQLRYKSAPLESGDTDKQIAGKATPSANRNLKVNSNQPDSTESLHGSVAGGATAGETSSYGGFTGGGGAGPQDSSFRSKTDAEERIFYVADVDAGIATVKITAAKRHAKVSDIIRNTGGAQAELTLTAAPNQLEALLGDIAGASHGNMTGKARLEMQPTGVPPSMTRPQDKTPVAHNNPAQVGQPQPTSVTANSPVVGTRKSELYEKGASTTTNLFNRSVKRASTVKIRLEKR